MNIFGLTITTDARQSETARRREFFDERAAAGDTPEQAFAAWYNLGAAEETDEDMATTRRLADRITKIALYSSLFHQMSFFLAAAASLFSPEATYFTANPMMWAKPLSVLTGSIAIPIVIDLTSLFLVRKMTMKVASMKFRIACFVALWIPAGASGLINYYAPSPHVIFNYGFSGIVITIPLVHGIRAIFKPYFDQLMKRKQDILAQVATPVEPAAPVKRAQRGVTKAERTARAKWGYDEKSPADQKAFRDRWDAKLAKQAAKNNIVEDTFDTAAEIADRETVNV